MKIKVFRVSLIIAFLVCSLSRTQGENSQNTGLIGVSIPRMDGTDGEFRTKMFVDVMKGRRVWQNAKDRTVDENGWPTPTNDTIVTFGIFELRPHGGWTPEVANEPDGYKPDWSGIYNCSFQGKADVHMHEGPGAKVFDLKYESVSNTTTFKVDFPRDLGLLAFDFYTQRNGEASAGSGFSNLHVIRPEYPVDSKEAFTQSFLNSLAPFSVLRVTELNTGARWGREGDDYAVPLEWAKRRLTTDSTQQSIDGKFGIAWEYIVELANTTHKDIWINVPLNATDDYVKQLAVFLKDNLKPNIKVYVGFGDEIHKLWWPVMDYLKKTADAEIKTGDSNLNHDGMKDVETLAHRYRMRRFVVVANGFRFVWGDSAMMTRIYPVFSDDYKNAIDSLTWAGKIYGTTTQYAYAVAIPHVFRITDKSKTGSKDEILADLRNVSDENTKNIYIPFIKFAHDQGLKAFVYSGGSETGSPYNPKAENLANRIMAERDPEMKTVVEHDIRDNWLALGGDLYIYDTLVSAYWQGGCHGLTEDIDKLDTPKYQAIQQLAQWHPK